MNAGSPWNDVIVFLSLIPFILLISSCKGEEQKSEGRTVAEAYGERLTEEELKDKVPASLPSEDSQSIARSLIRDWVRERVLLRKARERLSGKGTEISERVEAYKRSLMIHHMEKQIIKDDLDTTVTRKEVASYYADHRKDLILSEPALRYVHVQLSRDSAQYLARFMRAMRKDSSERLGAMRPLCEAHAVDCSIKGDRWVRMGAFLTRLPLDIENEKRFLEKRKLQRYEKEGNIFLLRILEHRAKDSVAPLSMVEDRVRSMILNERRERILERVHQNALIDARKKNEVRIHEN